MKKQLINMTCCVALMVMCGLRFALAEGIGSAAVPRCGGAPELAAGLDAPAWQAAVALTNFCSVGMTNEPIHAITARLMRDESWFYVGFDVRHPDPERIVPKVGRRDARVQGENCVKVALAPGEKGKSLYIFRLSAGNIKSDQAGSIEWNVPWRSAVKRTATGWQAMLALPLRGFSEKADWQVVRLNLLVHVFKPLFDNNGVPVSEERLVYSWQPVGSRWWDEADKFAWVTGLGGDPAQRLLASWTMPEAQGLTLTNGRYQYAVTMQVKNEGNQTGCVWVGVSDRPVAGQGDSVNMPITLEAGATNNVRVDVPVKTLNKRGMIVTLGEREGGDEWDRLVVEEAKTLTIFDGWLDRNYYTDEKSAFVVCRIGLPAEGLKGMTVQAQDKHGNVLSTAPAQAPETRVEVALGKIEAGRHELKVELKGADGVVMAARNEELIKRPPRPGREWKIDRVSRMLLHNGNPKFVYGIDLGGWNPAVLSDENLREIKDAGFSTIMFWAFQEQTPETVLAALDRMAKMGLYMGVPPEVFVHTPECRDRVQLPKEMKFRGFTNLKGSLIGMADMTRAEKSAVYAKAFEQAAPFLRAGIERIKDHPALMFYESFDEPVEEYWFDQYAQGREFYRLMHDVDGYHPVRVTWNSRLPTPLPKYTDWRDIICRDPYWSAPAVSYRDQPVWVGDQTMDLAARSLEERKPVWLVPLSDCTGYSYTHKRLMLPEEQRCQTYLAVIHGASGFTYFYYPVVHQAMWETLANLGAELKRLEPLLAMPAAEQSVVESLANKGLEEPTPVIRARLLKGADGEHVLLAANSRYNPAEVTFQIPCLDGVRRVKGLFDGKRYSVRDGILSDRIEGLGTRAYRWEKVPAAASPEEIKVNVNVETGRVAETQVPRSGRMGQKNAMPNPSFEEATVPGIPDYWRVTAHTPPLRAEERTGMKLAKYSLDDRDSYHGRYAFRLQGQGRAVWTYFSPRHDQPTEYRLSLYLKADPEGQKVRIFGSGGLKVKGEFIPTREWKRYETRLEVPAQAERGASWFLGVDGSGSVWLDAVQIEQGCAATSFEP